MKIRTNIKAGALTGNHNEKIMNNNNNSIENGKRFIKKLSLKKETIRELRESDLKQIAGGRFAASSECSTCQDSVCGCGG